MILVHIGARVPEQWCLSGAPILLVPEWQSGALVKNGKNEIRFGDLGKWRHGCHIEHNGQPAMLIDHRQQETCQIKVLEFSTEQRLKRIGIL